MGMAKTDRVAKARVNPGPHLSVRSAEEWLQYAAPLLQLGSDVVLCAPITLGVESWSNGNSITFNPGDIISFPDQRPYLSRSASAPAVRSEDAVVVKTRQSTPNGDIAWYVVELTANRAGVVRFSRVRQPS